ncbi:hypothetical protein [Pseudomonas aeruginosa]|uniref:hypothetical protein n=1 Tax=Pseudomonas aeruginosa TaxID=287 RepID=UPI0015C572D3|nr:hypothetical protein [Pseudomonas aeruginosa]NPW92376.1 hypothetical protein [Pseudomonas aeruginosa]
MGFLSNLFGGNKEDKALREALAHIHRILDDEKFQLELVHPMMKAMLESAPAYDKDPNGSGPFGFTETNPIPVNGPIGQLAYLSRLETQSGQRILFHRLGAIDKVDVFEAVTFDGSGWFIFFVDLYHPRRSRLTPDGFRFTKDVAQFSGFHKFCENFPYDFVEKKASEQESGLSMAYIAVSKVSDHIHNRAFNRPLAHKVKLDLIKGHLSSFQPQ